LTKGRGSQSGCARRGLRMGFPLGRVRIVVRDRQSQTWWARVLSQSLTCFGPTWAFSHAQQRFVAGRVMVPWQNSALLFNSSYTCLRAMLGHLLLTIAVLALFHGGNSHRLSLLQDGANPPLTAAFSAYERMSLPDMSHRCPTA